MKHPVSSSAESSRGGQPLPTTPQPKSNTSLSSSSFPPSQRRSCQPVPVQLPGVLLGAGRGGNSHSRSHLPPPTAEAASQEARGPLGRVRAGPQRGTARGISAECSGPRLWIQKLKPSSYMKTDGRWQIVYSARCFPRTTFWRFLVQNLLKPPGTEARRKRKKKALQDGQPTGSQEERQQSTGVLFANPPSGPQGREKPPTRFYWDRFIF